jgi:EmrB/QacA subfamily drug resistance transporter
LTRLALLVAATFFMEFLDGSILTTALPKIAAAMGVHAIDLNIGVSIYSLTLSVFILPGAWLVERFGAKRVFTSAIVLFTLSSALCGFSREPWFFIACRALQGVGGALMVPVGRLAVLRATPKTDIMRATALLTWPALTAPLIGPPLGGYLTDALSWRAIFFVNLPIGVVGAILAWAWTPTLETRADKPFDWTGFALAGVALGSALVGLDQVSGLDDWIAGGLIALAVAAGLAFVARMRRATHPLVDLAPMRIATFRLSLTGGTAARAFIAAVPFLLPLMFQLGMGFDALRAGLTLAPLFVGNIGIKPFTTPILRWAGFRRVLIVNAALQAATMFACAGLAPGAPPLLVGALLLVSGASRSMHFTALATLPFADVPADEMNMANLIFSVSFQAAFAFGVGIAAALMRLGAFIAEPPLSPFRFGFCVLGILMLAAMLSHARLAPDAGLAVTRRRGDRG